MANPLLSSSMANLLLVDMWGVGVRHPPQGTPQDPLGIQGGLLLLPQAMEEAMVVAPPISPQEWTKNSSRGSR